MIEIFNYKLITDKGSIEMVNFEYDYDGWDDNEYVEVFSINRPFPRVYSDNEYNQLLEKGREEEHNLLHNKS